MSEFQRVLDQAWGSTIFGRGDRTRSTDSRPSNADEMDSLDEANTRLRTLLDMTSHANLASTLAPPSNSPRPHRPSDLQDDNRRAKRRKLDSGRAATKVTPFRYGKYGQVEAGQLRMEIVSCDGGMFSNESSYAAENILKNDASVYCTKGNRCNIVLRHEGATAFTIQELVIKGPTSMNYSHPIREGMVFVAMNQDEVLSRTAQYQIQYAPTSRDPCWSRHDDDDDPPLYYRGDGSTGRVRPSRAAIYHGDDDDYRIAQMPPEFSTNMPNVGVSTECSDEDEGDGESRRFRRPPNRIGALAFETVDSDEDDDFNPSRMDFDNFTIGLGGGTQQDYSSMSLADASEAHTHAMQEAIRAVGGQLLAPHARFFIEKRKSTCTIRFDPPVSGRFILLKMWNSHHDPSCNIDIQSVIAKGFAGPRYFPSVSLR